ncbi:MAG: T9SS type A sorting domain-containing protein [Candidatus Poribacteria bacterium]|nr:T9SS type A sorting domain-containing protein [Candidatus Poribacteria bacterium]
MKTIQLLTLIFLFISTLFLPSTFGQDASNWDLPEGAIARLGKGALGSVRYSPDGNQLIVRSAIGIWIYDAHTSVELDFISENDTDILGLSRDTQTFASLGSDNTLQLRSFPDGDLKITLNGDAEEISRVSFSPDDRTLAGSAGKEIYLWDVATGEQIATLSAHNRSITSFTFSPDGAAFASASWDGNIHIWNAATGAYQTSLMPYTGSLSSITFSPDGKTLASSSFNNRKVVFWDVDTWEPKGTLNLHSGSYVTFSPDGKSLITKGSWGRLYLWDIASGTLKTELTGHVSRVSSVAFSPDGNTLASCSSDQLYLWDWRSGEQKMSISGHTKSIYAIAFSPDNGILATGSRGEINLWDVATGTHKTELFDDDWSHNFSLTFSPDSRILASEIGWRIRLWDITTEIHQATINGYRGSSASGSGVSSMAFSPNGKYFASASSYSTILLWYSGRIFKSELDGHTDSVNSVDFSYHSRTLASGSDDHTVRLWDVITDTLIDTFKGHTDEVHSVKFSPDASILASGSKDGTIILWDVGTGELLTSLTGHPEGVNNVAFSVDGKTLASSGWWYDNTVYLWDVATGQRKDVLYGHTGSVYDIAFSPDGKTLASGSTDGTVLLWNFTSETSDGTSKLAEDVNDDGIVDIQDLIFVASQFGQPGADNAADVNGDGVVDITDILTVAAALQNANGAPAKYSQSVELLTAAEVQQWLSQARQVNSKTPSIKRGIVMLEHLLAVLTPKKTMLLNNYPNPFNPETWIPYQLAENADVKLRIYSADGKLIRTLLLGHQPAGLYQSQNRAAYWDGKNELGELVASGIYFYTLSTGKFSATQRMIIRK